MCKGEIKAIQLVTIFRVRREQEVDRNKVFLLYGRARVSTYSVSAVYRGPGGKKREIRETIVS
jgi:hypothetical protein